MVQKTAKPARAVKKPPAAANAAAPSPEKKRGRPRGYEPEVALARALDLFRRDGYAATSLDALSAATGMNRPSLYAAFGDKRALYIKSYQRYRADARARSADIFNQEMPIRERLARIYAVAIDIYLAGIDAPSGCFTVLTAASDAVADPEIRAIVQEALGDLDRMFASCFATAIARGELAATADPKLLGQIAAATLHTLAVRARARIPRAELDAIARGTIDLICGPAR